MIRNISAHILLFVIFLAHQNSSVVAQQSSNSDTNPKVDPQNDEPLVQGKIGMSLVLNWDNLWPNGRQIAMEKAERS